MLVVASAGPHASLIHDREEVGNFKNCLAIQMYRHQVNMMVFKMKKHQSMLHAVPYVQEARASYSSSNVQE